jgi:hypothetical protein
MLHQYKPTPIHATRMIRTSRGMVVADLTSILESHDLPPALDWPGTLEQVPVTRTHVAAVLARIFDFPITHLEILAQAGRFARVEYALPRSPDPDIVISLASHSRAINRAIERLQVARSWNKRNPQLHRRTLLDCANRCLQPLADMEPHRQETRFVLNWMYDVTSWFDPLP